MKFANALLAVAGLALPLALAADPLLQVTAIKGPTGAQACTDPLTFSATVVAVLGTPTGNFQFLDNSTPAKVLCQTPVGTGTKADLGLLSTDQLAQILANVLSTATGADVTTVLTAVNNAVPKAIVIPTPPNPLPAVVPQVPQIPQIQIPNVGRRLLQTVDLAKVNGLLSTAITTANGVVSPAGTIGNTVVSLLTGALANSLYTVTCKTTGGTLAPGTYTYGGVGLPAVAGTGTILAALAPALGATPAVALPASFTIGPCPTPAPTPASTTGCPTGITITSSIPEITIPACLAPTFTVTLTGLPAAATTLPTVSINGFGGNLLKQILSPTDAGFSIAKGLTVTATAGGATVTATMPATSLKHGTYSAVATVDGCPDLTAKVPFEQTIACLTKVNGRRLAM